MGIRADQVVASKTIFLFPGQGSQFVGMGKALCADFSVARHVFEEAEEHLKFKLKKLCFDGPESELKKTQNTQPAILTVSCAVYEVFKREIGLVPALLAGHSLGEYTALVVAEALKFSDAVYLVRERGKAMQAAVPEGQGAMAAFLGAKREQVMELCEVVTRSFSSDQEFVSPANFNGGGQVVVSGTAEAVQKSVAVAKTFGIRMAKLLNVSAPFHCKLMQPAADHMAKLLEKVSIASPRVPYIANVDAAICHEASKIKDLLIRQIPNPVQWEASMRKLAGASIEKAFEIGPGKVLTGLLRRINKDIQAEAIETAQDVRRVST